MTRVETILKAVRDLRPYEYVAFLLALQAKSQPNLNEPFAVKLAEPGTRNGQGVGYLDDGTIVVVEGGQQHIGNEVKVNVVAVKESSAGLTIFGQCNVGSLHETDESPEMKVVPGDQLTVQLVKTRDQMEFGTRMGGKGVDQLGFGYLTDGSTVAVENGKQFIGNEVSLIVTSVLPTPKSHSPTSRMIFGRLNLQSGTEES